MNGSSIASIGPDGTILVGELDKRTREYYRKYETIILGGIQMYNKE